MQRTEKDYEDMLYLFRPVSETHPPMSMSDRAAQFAPFAALTGHEQALAETARQTDAEIELGEDAKENLERMLRLAAAQIGTGREFEFTFFVPDTLKSGGKYVSVQDAVQKLDTFQNIIYLQGGTEIELSNIISILPIH